MESLELAVGVVSVVVQQPCRLSLRYQRFTRHVWNKAPQLNVSLRCLSTIVGLMSLKDRGRDLYSRFSVNVLLIHIVPHLSVFSTLVCKVCVTGKQLPQLTLQLPSDSVSNLPASLCQQGNKQSLCCLSLIANFVQVCSLSCTFTSTFICNAKI